MENILVKILGFIATVLHGDVAVFDRWMWLRKNITNGHARTLDAGCGSGAFTLYAAKVGNDAIGISFDARNNRVAEERAKILGLHNVKFAVADLRKLDDKAQELGVFDQIICFETIEHIINDRKLIIDFSKLLKLNGKLLLTAPYKHSKPMPGDEILSTVEDGGHVRWGYTHSEIREILSEAGLRTEKEEYITGFISQLLIRFNRVLSFFIPPKLAWLAVFPFRIFQVFDKLATKLTRYPFASIGIVAVKHI